MTRKPDRVRVAFTMHHDDYSEIKQLAEAEGMTFSAYLRNAVTTYRYIKGCTQRGAKILTEQDGTQREVVFR